MSAPRHLQAGRLAVEIHPDRAALGRAAGRAVARHLRELLARQGAARVIFACAPSQDEFLAALVAASRSAELGFDWAGVTAFHMDDYVGFAADHPQSFRRYLRAHLLDHVAVGAFHPLPAELPPPVACARYAALLAAAPNLANSPQPSTKWRTNLQWAASGSSSPNARRHGPKWRVRWRTRSRTR